MKLIRLAADSKIPVKGESWKDGISDDPELHAKWREQGFNLGLPLEENNRSVLDFDGIDHENGREFAREFYKRHRDLCTYIVETAAGNIHFHFEGKTKTRKILHEGKEIGDIKGNGYVVWIGSTIRDKAYRLIADGPLPPVSELDKIYPIIEKEYPTEIPILDLDMQERFRRAEKWMEPREGKEDGNGRGLQMIKTCRALFVKFGLSEELVRVLARRFNTRNVPPYSEKLLEHKIQDAKKGLT